MPIISDLRCIFIHIPKTGGTSIEYLLGINVNDLTPDTEKIFGIKDNKVLQHLTAMELRKEYIPRDKFEGYFKFAFVRNPYDRILSEYLWHIQRTKTIKCSFRDFLLAIDKLGDRWKKDGHLKLQSDYIYDDKSNLCIDFLGRFEHLNKDWEFIAKKLHIEKELPKLQTSYRKKQYRKNYMEFFTEETKEMVYNKYYKDFINLGYKR